ALPWRRLGLRGRLFAAFGAVAVTTVLASGNALISYDGLGRSLGVVTGTSLPQVTRAAKIAKTSAEVVAGAQALLAANDAAERERTTQALNAARQELMQSVDELPAQDAAKLKETAGRMSQNLDKVARAVAERQALAAERRAMVDAVRGVHQKLGEKLAPMADDASFSLTLGLQTATEKAEPDVIQKTLAGLADNELASLQAVLELRAEANLVLGLLVEAADLQSRELMPPVKDRFVAAAGRLDKAKAALKDAEISKLVTALVDFGKRN